MRLLLDTHAFIWWVDKDTELSARARDAIQNGTNQVYVSAVTAYEIATKVRARRLSFDVRRLENFPDSVADLGFEGVPISLAHGSRAGLIPGAHKDPFDRLLAAQCELEGLTLVTKDKAFAAFRTSTLW